jgi:erythromycin esterase-like protein/predicted phosphoribosyltransferase
MPYQHKRFRDRADAGRELARHLRAYAGRSDVTVLGLPRGGIPVAAEVAKALNAPFDAFLVRKLGVPGHEELAMGAIAEGAVQVLNTQLIRDLGISRQAIDEVATRERLELERRDRLYRGDRQPPLVRDRIVILIDDGLATGATMEAAILALRQLQPSRIIAAAPVGAVEPCQRLRARADEVICAVSDEGFGAVGYFYEDFSATTDEEVRALLGHQRAGASSLRERIRQFTRTDGDEDFLVDLLGSARVVLIGEASHGTHEFYRTRARLSQRLIAEKGFLGVAAEADWPDAYRVNRYVRGEGTDRDATAALAGFRRFPAWMWRNTDVRDFVDWLRRYNDTKAVDARAGFYGLDLYSLHSSMDAVIAYLTKVDPEAAVRARERYACFDRFGGDIERYAQRAGLGLSSTCEREVTTQLTELRRAAAEYASRDGRVAADDFFVAEQNARLVTNAEAYYRTMIEGHVESWNLRDRHMVETLGELLQFLDRGQSPATLPAGLPAKLIVWAHNSHLGDARATSMHDQGELNVGQLVRERFGAQAILVGFTTHTGTVTAASNWDGPTERKTVRPSLAGSVERLLHDAGVQRGIVSFRSDLDLASAFAEPRLERAIGVIYRPDSERRSHYFHARVSAQFDVLIHIDETTAVEPLDATSSWTVDEPAETYPSGL